MIEAFMIEYEFAGEKHFANVVTYKGSPSVFYVTPINAIYDMPGARIILHLENNKFLLAEQSAFAGEGLIKAIGEKIAADLVLKRGLNSPPTPSLYSS